MGPSTSTLSFLDAHSGLMLVILTAVYVGGTFLMWWEMRSSRIRMDAPNLQILLEPQIRWGNFFDLVISNIGNVPIYDLKLTILPKGLNTLGTRKLEDINLFKKSMPVFGKGQSLRTFAVMYPDFINSDQSKEIMFIAEYKTFNGKKFKQEYRFDMEVYRNMSASNESNLSDVISEMKNITKELKTISDYFTDQDRVEK